jgi:hypothetical protein
METEETEESINKKRNDLIEEINSIRNEWADRRICSADFFATEVPIDFFADIIGIDIHTLRLNCNKHVIKSRKRFIDSLRMNDTQDECTNVMITLNDVNILYRCLYDLKVLDEKLFRFRYLQDHSQMQVTNQNDVAEPTFVTETEKRIEDINNKRFNLMFRIDAIQSRWEREKVCVANYFATQVTIDDICTLRLNDDEHAIEFREEFQNSLSIGGTMVTANYTDDKYMNEITTLILISELYNCLQKLAVLDQQVIQLLHLQNHLQTQVTSKNDVAEPTDNDSGCMDID